MPIDFAILTKLDKSQLGNALIKATGNTQYTWQSFEGDIQLDLLNEFITFEGTAKLAQAIYKIVLTPLGSDIDDPQYGTSLNTSIGSDLDSTRFAEIQTQIVAALRHLNLINQDNPNSDEVIETIDNVRVVNYLNDPRAIAIQIQVTTESGKPVAVTVPQVI